MIKGTQKDLRVLLQKVLQWLFSDVVIYQPFKLLASC